MANQKTGMLIVITGASGSGKDSVAKKILNDSNLAKLNLKRLMTCADRVPRSDETEGEDYYFVTPKELNEMSAKGKLVEKPQPTGTSRKGTPRHEFEAVLTGEKRLWRIEPFLASKVASGIFFDEQFDTEKSRYLKALTRTICITSPQEQIDGRRKFRDGEKYDSKEYELRDIQEKPNLDILERSAIIVQNMDGQLKETVNKIANLLLKENDKIRK